MTVADRPAVEPELAPEPDPNILAEIVGLYEIDRTVSVAELAEAWNVGVDIITRALVDRGVAFHPIIRRLESMPLTATNATETLLNEAVRLYVESTITLDAIAEAFGFGRDMIRKAAIERGLKTRGKGAIGLANKQRGQFDLSGPMPVWIEDTSPLPKQTRKPSARRNRPGAGRPRALLDETEQRVVKLYVETGIPVKQIMWAYDIKSSGHFQNILSRARIESRTELDGGTARDVWQGHFEIINGEPVWRDEAAQSAQPALIPEPTPVETTVMAVADAPVRRIIEHVAVPARLIQSPAQDTAFVLTYMVASRVVARTPDEAIEMLREAVGRDIEISSVMRA